MGNTISELFKEKNYKILSYFVNEKNVGKKTIKNKLFR